MGRDQFRVEGGGGRFQKHFLAFGGGDVEEDGEVEDFLDGDGGGGADVADDDLGVDAFFDEGFHLFEDFDGEEYY